jgi:hypothetical protein
MTKDTTVQHVGSTLSFPRKHVMGVFDSLQEGEQAVQALVDAGYHAEDIAFIPSQDFPSALQEHLRTVTLPCSTGTLKGKHTGLKCHD